MIQEGLDEPADEGPPNLVAEISPSQGNISRVLRPHTRTPTHNDVCMYARTPPKRRRLAFGVLLEDKLGSINLLIHAVFRYSATVT